MFSIAMLWALVALAMARDCHEHRAEIEQGPPLLGAWKPDCVADGTYSPVQCQEAVCMCYTADGEVMEDYQVSIGEAANMDCKCARERDEYIDSGMIGKLFFCDANGNYSKVQCLGSVCFCADENGLAVDNGQGGVHISDKDKLQC